jgi:hypothetical protein
MAIKFTGKDQPKAAPIAARAPVEKIDREPAAAAINGDAPDGTDLFNDTVKAPGKRKSRSK